MGRPTIDVVTDKTVRAAVARAQREKRRIALTIGGVGGLQVRISPAGEASYCLRYRSETGEQRALTFRSGYPDFGLGEAREHARKLLNRATDGIDPWQAKQDAKAAAEQKRRAGERTLRSAVEAWLASREVKAWRETTRAEIKGVLRRNVLTSGLADREAATITRDDVRDLADSIADGNEKRKGSLYEAHHTVSALRMLFNWLLDQRHYGIATQPVVRIRLQKLKPRDRVYTNAEVRAVLAAVKGTVAADLVGLLFHTATRDEETRAARWQDIDLERGVWTIPGDVSKNERPHAVALSAGALDVLRRIRAHKVVAMSPYVFPLLGQRRKGDVDAPTYMGRPKDALEAASRALGFPLRLHDIRRTVGDRVKCEFGPAMQHAILGHSEDELTRTYGPTPALKLLAQATAWWSDELATITAREKSEAGANEAGA